MQGEVTTDRMVLCITGADREKFLHGLVTRDLGAPDTGLVYSALLTPQGKYLADFFLLNRGADILLDVKADLAQGLAQRLMMYRLRADVGIADSGLSVARCKPWLARLWYGGRCAQHRLGRAARGRLHPRNRRRVDPR